MGGQVDIIIQFYKRRIIILKFLKSIGVLIAGVAIGFLIGFFCKHFESPLIISGEQFGSFADWFGAIGTIAAVIVALNSRWDFLMPVAEKKLNKDISLYNERINKQYSFINSFSTFSMYYLNLFKKLNEGEKINREESLDALIELTKRLKSTSILTDTKKLDNIIKCLESIDVSSSNFEDELKDLIRMIARNVDSFRKEISDYVSKNESLYKEIQKIKKKYKIPEELID